MATDEEYLDSLLKSVGEDQQPPRKMEDVIREVAEIARKMESYPAAFKEAASVKEEKDSSGGNEAGQDLLREDTADNKDEDTDEWKIDLDQLLERADMLVNEEMAGGFLEPGTEEYADFLDKLEVSGDIESMISDTSAEAKKDADASEGMVPSEEAAADMVEDIVSSEETSADTGMDTVLSEETSADTGMDTVLSEEAAADISKDIVSSEEMAADMVEDMASSEEMAADMVEDMASSEEMAADMGGDMVSSEEMAADMGGDMVSSEETSADVGMDTVLPEKAEIDIAADTIPDLDTAADTVPDLDTDIDTDTVSVSGMDSVDQDSADSESEMQTLADMERMEMMDNMENHENDPDLAEINSLLDNVGKSDFVDDDMLALLESSEESQNEYDSGDEVFDIFSEEMQEVQEDNKNLEEQAEEEEEKPKKKKGEKKKKEKKEKKPKKKKAGKKEADSEEEADGKKKKTKKGPGLFAGILAKFSQEDEEEENGNDEASAKEQDKLLEELDDTKTEKTPKKEKKGKKEKAAGKGKKKEAKPAKKKSPPKKKKEKKSEPIDEKPPKPLNKAQVAVLMALCATLIAGIYIVGTFLPEFVDKQSARSAFAGGDYETVYRLFYDKKLSGNEKDMYDKARTILRLEKKLDSYENNMAMGKELEAVHALMTGISYYQNMPEADQYGVRAQVDVIYQQICSILESNYGVSEEEALQIVSGDDVAYTRDLNRIVFGIGSGAADDTGSAEPDSEFSAEPQDVLPEEEELLGD